MNRYDLRITGKDLKRFLKNLQKLKIQLYNIRYYDKSIVIQVNEEDYQKIGKIKTIYEIEVIRLYGPVRVIQFLRNYRFFFLFLILGLAIMWGLTHVIFDVTVVHNKKDIRDLIFEELKENGISKYKLVLSFDKQEKIVEEVIKKHRDTIEWMEIERVGVSYIVKVEERKIKDLDDSEEPRDLVAKKDGLITNIEASSGSVLVTPGTYVKKGDILVTGKIMNKEILMAKVKAEGVVFAETWYDVTVELPYHYSEVKKTGNKHKVLSIKFLGKEFNLFDFSPFTDKNIKTIGKIENSLLPISIMINEEEELVKKDVIYTKDTAIMEASRLGREKLKKKLGPNDEILYEKSLKITEEDSKIVIVIFFKVKEDITDYQPIKEEEEIKEES